MLGKCIPFARRTGTADTDSGRRDRYRTTPSHMGICTVTRNILNRRSPHLRRWDRCCLDLRIRPQRQI